MDRRAEPEAIVRGLGETTARIDAVARRLSPVQLMTPPTPGSWSPNEILWHIRATADVDGEHLARILDEDEPQWRHVSPRARMKKAHYNELSFAESLAAFVAQREALLRRLKELPPRAWRRIAIVKVPHKPEQLWQVSLHQLAWGMADHEQGHCGELEKAADGLGAL